jgi:hypothetical protein
MSVSQNGWTVIAPDDMDAATKVWTIPGQNRNVQLRLLPGAAGFVLAHFALWFDRTIEDIEHPIGDDFAWAYREISGSNEFSNHASATAIDLNASIHPQGKANTFTIPQRDRLTDSLRGKYLGCIRGGYTFRTTVDDMHFELAATRTPIHELGSALFDTPLGKRLREANPWLNWKGN